MTTQDDRLQPSRPRPTPPSSPGGPRRQPGRPNGGRNKKIANGLVALSTAAVLAVYGVGYARTAPATSVANNDLAPLAASLAATETPTTAPATATSTSTATTAPPTNRGSSARTSSSGAPTSTRIPIPTRTPTATATASTASSAATAGAYRDGTYTGTGTSRHGSIGVTILIKNGKIASADITTCGTRYPCSKIANLPDQVVERQSANIDFVSGSTDSSTAFRAAVKAALAKAA